MKKRKSIKRFFFATLAISVLVAYSYSFASIYKCSDNNGIVIFSTTKGTGCALLTEFDVNPNHSKWVGQKLTFEFSQTDIRSIIRLIADVIGKKIVWKTDVKGKISLNLIDVPWDQATEIMLKPKGLTCYIKDEMLFVVQMPKRPYISERETMVASDGSKHISSNGTERDGVYVADANGIVRDTRSGLEWKAGPERNIDWYSAKSWVQSLNLDGGGWRMPTTNELRTLHKKGAGTRNMTPLLKTSGWVVWSSGETKDSSLTLGFDFYSGDRYWGPRNNSCSFRAFAVRSRSDG